MKHSAKEVLVLLSGGIDSTSCLKYYLNQKQYRVRALHVSYGQAAQQIELKNSSDICAHFNVPFSNAVIQNEQSFQSGELLGRNGLLIFAALMFGRMNSGLVTLGIHAGTPYFDCSEAFFEKCASLVADCSAGRVQLDAPFLKWKKQDIFSFAFDEKIPLELTYSCEAGTTPECGACLSCKDRRQLTTSLQGVKLYSRALR